MLQKVILTVLVIPLIIVMAAKDPVGMGRLAEFTITAGAKLLNAVAIILSGLLGGHAR